MTTEEEQKPKYNQAPKNKQDILWATGTMIVILLCLLWVGTFAGFHISLDPSVLVDRTVHPSSHALYGIVTTLPPGSGTYCVNAETLSRGEPVDIGIYYIYPKPATPDRFGSTENTQGGAVFTTDNDHVVNETVTVPGDATDVIVTASYKNYIDENQVHVQVRNCAGKVAP